jgi:hypothetical protein
MPELFDLLDDPTPDSPDQLRPLILREEPVLVIAFTTDVDEMRDHFEKDPTVNTYVACPGIGCPLCFLKAAATDVVLLPLLNLEDQEVQVLRVPKRYILGSLGSIIFPILRRPDLTDNTLALSRANRRYRVDVQPLADTADRCTEVIEEYLARRRNGLKLTDAVLHLTAQELADVPRIRRKLDAIGGYEPPGKDSTEREDDGDHR